MTNSPRLPRWVYLPAVLGAIFVVLPLVAMVAKVDWPRFGTLISSPSSTAALRLSLETSLASTALCVLFGVPLAMVLARTEGALTRIVRPLILLPLVLPPVVGGIALLYAFGRLGLVGRYLETAGVHIAFTTVAVVLAKVRPEHAAKVLGELPSDFAAKCILRMLGMEPVQREILDKIETTLRTEFMSNVART